MRLPCSGLWEKWCILLAGSVASFTWELPFLKGHYIRKNWTLRIDWDGVSFPVQEQEQLYLCSGVVSSSTFEQPNRYVKLWVKLVTPLIKNFFWKKKSCCFGWVFCHFHGEFKWYWLWFISGVDFFMWKKWMMEIHRCGKKKSGVSLLLSYSSLWLESPTNISGSFVQLYFRTSRSDI